MRKLRTWREYLINRLASNRERASGYLQAALEDYQIHGEPAVFLLALQTVIESQGGISALAKQIETHHKPLWKYLITMNCHGLRFSLLSSTHLGVRFRFSR